VFRARRMRPIITIETVTIIKSTRIIIGGEIQFNFICTRDKTTDQGDVNYAAEADALKNEHNADSEPGIIILFSYHSLIVAV